MSTSLERTPRVNVFAARLLVATVPADATVMATRRSLPSRDQARNALAHAFSVFIPTGFWLLFAVSAHAPFLAHLAAAKAP